MIAVMAVAAVSANAQWYIGGSFGLNFTKATKDADSQTTLNIAPEVGYNINDNWAVGAQVGFGMVNNLLGISEGSASESGSSFTITHVTLSLRLVSLHSSAMAMYHSQVRTMVIMIFIKLLSSMISLALCSQLVSVQVYL